MYWCPRCQTETERKRHRCGTPTVRMRGLPWLDNDGVNAVSTLAGAAVGAACGLVWRAVAARSQAQVTPPFRWDSTAWREEDLRRGAPTLKWPARGTRSLRGAPSPEWDATAWREDEMRPVRLRRLPWASPPADY
jgi:hypothetical protein